MEYFRIDGVDLPTPSYKIKYTRADMQLEAKRDLNAKMHKKTVRWNMLNIELAWNYLTDEQISKIEQMTQKEYFILSYYSPQLGGMGTMECYRGSNFGYTLYSLRKNKGEWTEFTMKFIER